VAKPKRKTKRAAKKPAKRKRVTRPMIQIERFRFDEEQRCRACSEAVKQGDACFIEIVSDWDGDGESQTWTFTHLACAIAKQRQEVREHLLATDREELRELAGEVQRLSPELFAEIAHAVPPDRKAMPLDDPFTLELLAQLDETPEDRALLAVLGDHLAQRGDDRGELIALQLAGNTGSRVAELCDILSFSSFSKPVWGIGFLRELNIILGGRPLATQAQRLANPSCRLLQHLIIWQNRRFELAQKDAPVDVTPGSLPRGLRVLDVIGGLPPLDLSWMPYLDTLVLDEGHELAHPTLRVLELRATDRATIEACARGMPGVERLKIERLQFGREPPADLGELLEHSGWLTRIRELELQGIPAGDPLRAAARARDIRLVETPLRTI